MSPLNTQLLAELNDQSDGAMPNLSRARSWTNRLSTAALAIVATTAGGIMAAAPPAQAAVAPELAPGQEQAGPVVTILQPTFSDILRGKSTPIMIGVQAGRNQPKTIEMYVDGHLATPKALEMNLVPSAAFKWDTTLFADGPHILRVRVTDTEGLIGQAEVTIYINNNKRPDQNAPNLQWLNISPGDVLNKEVQFRLKASDDFGVKYVFVYLNPADNPDMKPALRSWIVSSPPYEFHLDTRLLPDGMYALSAKAWDALENEGKVPPLLIGISNNSINPTWIDDLNTRSGKNVAKTTENPTTTTTVQAPAPDVKPAAPQPAAPQPAAPQPATTSDRTPATPESTQPRPQSNTGKELAFNNLKPEPRASMVELERNGALTAISSNTAAYTAQHRSGQAGMPLWARKMEPKLLHVPDLSDPLLTGRPQVQSIDVEPATFPFVIGKTSREFVPMVSERASKPATPSKASRKVAKQSSKIKVALAEIPRGLYRPGEPALSVMDHGVAALNPAPAVAVPIESPSHSGRTELRNRIPATPRTVANAPLKSSKVAVKHPHRAHVHIAQVPQRPAHELISSPAAGVGDGMTSQPQSVTGTLPDHTLAQGVERQSVPEIGPRSVPPERIADASMGNGTTANSADRLGTFLSLGGKTVVSTPRVEAHSQQNTVFAPRTTLPRLAAIDIQPRHRHGVMGSITVALAPQPATPAALPASYIAHHGDTVSSVAARFGLPASIVAASNKVAATAHFAKGKRVKLPQQLVVSYGGKPITSDVAPVLVGSTSVVPFRFLFQQQGGKVMWDNEHQQVTASNGTHQVTLTIGSRAAVVNKKEVMMDLAAFLLSGRTMIPVRFFEKALHAQVDWEPTTGRLFVAMAN